MCRHIVSRSPFCIKRIKTARCFEVCRQNVTLYLATEEHSEYRSGDSNISLRDNSPLTGAFYRGENSPLNFSPPFIFFIITPQSPLHISQGLELAKIRQKIKNVFLNFPVDRNILIFLVWDKKLPWK